MKSVMRVVFALLLPAAAGAGFHAWRINRENAARRATLESRLTELRSAIERTEHQRDAAERETERLARGVKEAEATAVGRKSSTTPEQESLVAAWERKVTTLRSLLARHAEWAIPEIALLSPDEFIFFARDAQLEGEEAQRKALRDLRGLAKRKLAAQFHDALHDFAIANNGRLPLEMAELSKYFKSPVPQEILDRYALTGATVVPSDRNNEWLLYERAPVDELYDSRHLLGVQMSVQMETNPAIYVMTRAVAAYVQANSGGRPTQAVDLVPYLEAPLDTPTLTRYFEGWQKQPATLGLDRFATRSAMMFRPIGAR